MMGLGLECGLENGKSRTTINTCPRDYWGQITNNSRGVAWVYMDEWV